MASKHDEDIALFLIGESYGSTLAILAARQFQDDPSSGPKNFDSIMVTAPAIKADMPPYPVYFTVRYLLAPPFPRATPFFMPNPISPERIWEDPEVLAIRTESKELQVDGSGKPFCLGTAVGLTVALETAREKAIPGFNQPYLILHGTDDFGIPICGRKR